MFIVMIQMLIASVSKLVCSALIGALRFGGIAMVWHLGRSLQELAFANAPPLREFVRLSAHPMPT